MVIVHKEWEFLTNIIFHQEITSGHTPSYSWILIGLVAANHCAGIVVCLAQEAHPVLILPGSAMGKKTTTTTWNIKNTITPLNMYSGLSVNEQNKKKVMWTLH